MRDVSPRPGLPFTGAPPSWRGALRRTLAGLSVVLAACSHTAERSDRTEPRLERLDSGGASTSAAASQQQSQQLETRLAAVEKQLAAARADHQKASDDAANRQKLADEVARLRAAVDSYSKRLDTLEGSVAQIRSNAPAVTQRAPSAPPPQRRPPTASSEKKRTAATDKSRQARTTTSTEAPPMARLALPSDRSQYLAFAREQESRDKSVARDLYTEYVNQFPNDPSAAEVHFRLGELAYGEKRYRDATLEFGKVAKEFPKSERAPDALLRTADSMLGLKLRDEAIAVLTQVPERYPDTPAAARATRRLAELSQGGTGSGNSK